MTEAVRVSKIIWFTLGGVLVGYLLVHPFAMLAYILGPQHPHEPWDFTLWGQQVRFSFSTDMLAMGLAFAFMGGVAGFFLGAWYLQKERLALARLESARQLAALETLRELMVTLAHHIRNANVVIGGFGARLEKSLSEPEQKAKIKIIRQASQDIEAVIAALESLTEIDRTQYASAWETKMIDLKTALAARLPVRESEEPHES
jgi:signal transduction histidine kinase